MAWEGEYEPSTWDWVAEQASAYEASNGSEANTLRDTGLPIIIVTTRGHRSGTIRKTPLMKVEQDKPDDPTPTAATPLASGVRNSAAYL